MGCIVWIFYVLLPVKISKTKLFDTMLHSLLIGFYFTVIFTLIGYIVQIFSFIPIRKIMEEFDWREKLVQILLGTLFFTGLLELLAIAENVSIFISIICSIMASSFLINFNFLILPIIILFRKSKYTPAFEYEKWARETIDPTLRIKVLKSSIVNAYATGILPQHKVILLTDKMLGSMEEKDIKNLIYHEYGHLRYHHLFWMYLTQLVCITGACLGYFYLSKMLGENYNGWVVGMNGGFWGGVTVVLAGLLQKRLEYQADKFAAESVGKEAYAETLQNLNIATSRGLEKESLSYPTLFNRIRYACGEELANKKL